MCQRAGRPFFCVDCDRQLAGCRFPKPPPMSPRSPVFAWGLYDGVLKRAIHTMKYENAPEIAEVLGSRLGHYWLEHSPLGNGRRSPSSHLPRPQLPLVVVPVPLHRDRLRQRGYNQAELIAAEFSRVTGALHLPRGLLRVKATAAQHQLTPKDRQHNLKGAFRLGPDWSIERMQSRVLLVDDIYTTGTTARIAAMELRRAGLRVVGIATAARAQMSAPGSMQHAA